MSSVELGPVFAPANNNGTMALIGVDYTEFEPDTLRGFFVYIGDTRHDFRTYDAASAFANSEADRVSHLSSVDDFIADSKRLRLVR